MGSGVGSGVGSGLGSGVGWSVGSAVGSGGCDGWSPCPCVGSGSDRFLSSRNDGLLVIGSHRATAVDNLVRGSVRRGIVVLVQTGLVASPGGGYGSRVAGGEPPPEPARNDTFRSNRSFDNGWKDCLDQTTGTKTLGTANTWVGNTSDGNDQPNGICPR